MKTNKIFHIHTYRCKHASDELDESYIKKAVTLGAKEITFLDHAPFPENPFGNRMDMKELLDYIVSLKQLKDQYAGVIDVKIGLEIVISS